MNEPWLSKEVLITWLLSGNYGISADMSTPKMIDGYQNELNSLLLRNKIC